ncbi:hypothetical protein V1477_005391 [Vespula maculifrons]|uniref:Uncharacterized protein n=1 Tax=Vespula maculifrons TaxID=7453 RepID=A0ABD2CPL8_VESMC
MALLPNRLAFTKVWRDQWMIGTCCLNRVMQRKSEDVVLHVKAGANWLQDKRLDVGVGLILISLPNHQQSLTEFLISSSLQM